MNIESIIQHLNEMQAVKGLISMKAKLKQFAKECVELHAVYNDDSQRYHIRVKDLPDFTQQEFASLILSHDRDRAYECTGPDNEKFNSQMLPALIRMLASPTSQYHQEEFATVWKESIASYHEGYMQEILDKACDEKNQGEIEWRIYG